MICLLEEHTLDRIVYHPIIKELEDKKKEHIVFNLRQNQITKVLDFISSNKSLEWVINYGGSQSKLTFAVLSKEYELKLINLHGEEVDAGENGLSFSQTISHLAYQNFVCADSPRLEIIDRGVETPIGVFECPITYLARKSEKVKPVEVVYISRNKEGIKSQEDEFIKNKITYKVFDYSDGLPNKWREIYSYLNNTDYIVSDSFIFDKPARFLNKHFFYMGMDVLNPKNLGRTTHLISNKQKLSMYLKQTWKEPKDINQRHGIQSLISIL